MITQLLKTRLKRAVTDSLVFTLPKTRVKVEQGVVCGVIEKLPDGRKFKRFSGIPYAKTPVGALRFKSPQKLEKFDKDEIDCSREGDECLHKKLIWNRITGSENCLVLNVYTPADVDSSKKLPVLVFIHGGAFLFDSGSRDMYSPEFLLMEDVIVVTLNFRYHLLGFISLPKMGISGNAGLKDQQMALEWVYDNISSFNGDQGNITLYGESGGAAMAQAHSLNDRSRKLFGKLILQSGTAVHDWFIQRNIVGKTKLAARFLGAKSESEEDCYETLMKSSARDIYKWATKTLDIDERRRAHPMYFKPTIELESDDAFLTKFPIDIIRDNEEKFNIPILLGINNAEGLMHAQDVRRKLHVYSDDLVRLIPPSVAVESDTEEAQRLGKEINRFYFGKKGINPKTFPLFVDLMTDINWSMRFRLCNELYVKHQPGCKQFAYEFCLLSRLSYFKTLLKVQDVPGSNHFDDVSYLFDLKTFGIQFTPDSREWKLRQMMCRLWTNFAKYGDPTPNHDTSLGFKWNHIGNVDRDPEKTPIDYLKIDNDGITMESDMYSERTAFWKEIYQKYNGGFHYPKYPFRWEQFQ